MNAKPVRTPRSAPSERARAELVLLLSHGVGRNENVVSEYVTVATRTVVQQLLEAEQADFLGARGRYARRSGRQRGSRNGYEPTSLRTSGETIKVLVPQVRNLSEPYRSHLLRIFDDDPYLLDRTVVRMYAPWLSTRDRSNAAEAGEADTLPVSGPALARVASHFSSDHRDFIDRDLSDIAVEHLFCDVAFESSKGPQSEIVLLVAWAIDAFGRKQLLQLALGDKASGSEWESVVRDLNGRNMTTPKTVTANGINGVIDALAEVFPPSVRIRHWFDRPSERKTGIA
jgi:putative transposase